MKKIKIVLKSGKNILVSNHLANLIKAPVRVEYPFKSFSYYEDGEMKIAKISEVMSVG